MPSWASTLLNLNGLPRPVNKINWNKTRSRTLLKRVVAVKFQQQPPCWLLLSMWERLAWSQWRRFTPTQRCRNWGFKRLPGPKVPHWGREEAGLGHSLLYSQMDSKSTSAHLLIFPRLSPRGICHSSLSHSPQQPVTQLPPTRHFKITPGSPVCRLLSETLDGLLPLWPRSTPLLEAQLLRHPLAQKHPLPIKCQSQHLMHHLAPRDHFYIASRYSPPTAHQWDRTPPPLPHPSYRSTLK